MTVQLGETGRMFSLIAHAVLGLATIGWIVAANRAVFAKPVDGPMFSPMEMVYYVIGIGSIVLGWYFNIRFVNEYSQPGHNPINGPGSWTHYIKLMFVNPAASSAGQDYTIINVVLLPLFTIVDGYRRGLRHPWLYFVSSLFTSCAFAYAFYFATMERQHRHAQVSQRVI